MSNKLEHSHQEMKIIHFFLLYRKLEERETLANRVQYLEARIAEKDEEIKLLSRKNALMEKNLKSQLALEQQKLKEIGQKYEMTLVETGKSYTNVVEVPILLIIIMMRAEINYFIVASGYQHTTTANHQFNASTCGSESESKTFTSPEQ